jgi:predicted phage-related endonuclease
VPIDAAIRSKGIGGSEIAAILGLDPRRDAFSVYAVKLGLVRRAPPNERMEAGKFLEQGISRWYASRTKQQVSWCDQTLVHPTRDWQVYSPDAFVGIDGPYEPWAGGLDCKNVAWDQSDKWGEPGTDAVPDSIHLQCQWYCSAADLPWWDVAACFGGNDLDIYRVHRDSEIETILLDEAEKFWRNHILARVPPRAGPSQATREALSQIYPKNTANLRIASPEEAAIMAELKLAKEAAKEAGTRESEAENRAKQAIGDSEGLLNGPWKVTWKKERDSIGTDWEAIARELALRLALLQQQVPEAFPLEWCETVDQMAAAKHFRHVTRNGARKLHANWGR